MKKLSAVRTEQHFNLFIYKALIDRECAALGLKIISSLKITILIPRLGNRLLDFMPHKKWNNLQRLVGFDRLIPFARFRALSAGSEQCESNSHTVAVCGAV